MASCINHSCVSNSRRSFIGDLMFIHATRDIPSDTELTWWYAIPTGGNHAEVQKSLDGWGFSCVCPACIDAKDTPKQKLKKRAGLNGDLKAAISTPDLPKAERLLTAMEKTYRSSPRLSPRFALFKPYFCLAWVYARQNDPFKAVALFLKALEALGFVITGAVLPFALSIPFEVVQWGVMMDGVVSALLFLRDAYAVFAPPLAAKVEDYARIAYKICVGEDVTFKETSSENLGSGSSF